MLRRMTDLPEEVLGVEAVGNVSKDDYDRVLEPLLDAATREERPLRFLYRFGPQFEGFTAGAAWEDAKLGLRFLRSFEACAVVTDVAWVRNATRIAGTFMPCPVKVFDDAKLADAVAWLVAQPAPTPEHEPDHEHAAGGSGR